MAVSWDLFGWPGPRHAVRSRMAMYRNFVERHAASMKIIIDATPAGIRSMLATETRNMERFAFPRRTC